MLEIQIHAVEQAYSADGTQTAEVGDRFPSVEAAAEAGVRARPVIVDTEAA